MTAAVHPVSPSAAWRTPPDEPGADEVLTSLLAHLGSRGVLALGMLEGTRLRLTNASFAAMFALPGGGSEQHDFGRLVADCDRPRVLEALAALHAIDGGASVRLGFEAVRSSGAPFEAEVLATSDTMHGRAVVTLLATDVTARRRAEKQLNQLAYMDALTGLPNRALLLDRLRDSLAQARKEERTFALCMCDLDGFKRVNDTLGHDAGDQLLAAVARRLEEVVRQSDTVARLGGDEFAVLLPRVASPAHVPLVAGRMVRALAPPFTIRGEEVRVGISIGVACYPAAGEGMDALLAEADAAMYASKRAGKNRFTLAEGRAPAPSARVAAIQWSSSHDVGVEAIDADHRDLADRVNVVCAALKAGLGQETLNAELEALVAATGRHFAREEGMMQGQPEFPGRAAHEIAHRMLLEDLKSLTVNLDATSVALALRFLEDWLMRHVHGLDRMLAEWLRQGHRPGGEPPARAHA